MLRRSSRSHCDLTHAGLFVYAALAERLPLEVLDSVGQVGGVSVDAGFFHAGIEQASGGADEGMAHEIFLISGLLAYEHDGRRGTAFAEDGLRRMAVEIAAPAILDGFFEGEQVVMLRKEVERGSFWGTLRHTGFDAARASQGSSDLVRPAPAGVEGRDCFALCGRCLSGASRSRVDPIGDLREQLVSVPFFLKSLIQDLGVV